VRTQKKFFTLRAPLKRCQLPAKHLVTTAASKIPDDHVTACNSM
jgi:hypothetical protein